LQSISLISGRDSLKQKISSEIELELQARGTQNYWKAKLKEERTQTKEKVEFVRNAEQTKERLREIIESNCKRVIDSGIERTKRI
jgi:sugar-specific transcriptional regulator TrmB